MVIGWVQGQLAGSLAGKDIDKVIVIWWEHGEGVHNFGWANSLDGLVHISYRGCKDLAPSTFRTLVVVDERGCSDNQYVDFSRSMGQGSGSPLVVESGSGTGSL
jgi:hypothetical protein